VPPLAELQAHVRAALVTGAAESVLPLLAGGRDPARRLAVHQRHYEASLVEALLTKFPATAWLAGSEFVSEAARAFLRRHSPTAPCIAEFGGQFPLALALRPGAEDMPYLQPFATLEWHLGRVAVAIEHTPLALAELAAMPADTLADLRLRLQPGLTYVAASWPVDELIGLYLEDRAPEQYRMEPAELWLEIRGARGVFAMRRLDAASFAFRAVLCRGEPIGVAAEMALDADATFDPGLALTALVNEGLAVTIVHETSGDFR
jgi:hypothetical protein